jgi:predicted Zn-dependent protease
MNRVPEALREYRAVRALQPDSLELMQNEAFALVMVGNGSEGWREMAAQNPRIVWQIWIIGTCSAPLLF